MMSAGFEWLGRSARMTVLLVGALLGALALGLVLTAGPAKATHTETCEFIDGVRVCMPDEHEDTVAPTVTGVAPAENATNVLRPANVTATFSEDMDTTTITPSTFTLVKNGTTTPVSAVVSYDSASKTATLNPNADLDSLATYTATVTSGAKDAAGNGLDQNSATAGEQPKTWSFTTQDHTPPGITANNGTVSVDEGQTATNTGSYSDNAGGDVRITASRGTVTKTGTASGTWSWSQATGDGPSQGGTVTITATDSSGNASSVSFTLTVRNVAPTATFNAPASADEGNDFTLSLTNPSDPSSADSSAGFTYAFDCGSGYGAFSSANSASCNLDSGTRTVKGKIQDKDGGVTEYSRTVTVNNVAPTATFNAPQTSYAGKTFTVSLNDPIDPSSADGFTYAFDCGTGSGYGAFGGSSVASCPAGTASKTVKGKIQDNDGGVTEYASTVTVNTAPQSYPNGRIAFDSNRDGNREIYAMNPDGSALRRLTSNTTADVDPAFSPDGSMIAFVSERDGDAEIYTMNANGTGQARLTSNAAVDYAPAFSPDGSKIAFTSTRDGNYELYVMNANGTDQTRLTSNTAFEAYPAFSPNGSQIAFAAAPIYKERIYTINSDGTGRTPLTNRETFTDNLPAFSPDGSKIAFTGDRTDGIGEIYAMNADGSALTRLTTLLRPHDTDAAFSPDGSKIAFTSDRDGSDQIYTMNADGTDQTRATTNTAFDAHPSWGGAGDTAPPETSLDASGPSGPVASTSASFSFSSEANATYECKLDSGEFAACDSPKSYTSLTDGDHTFQVRATDTSGNTDPTPESRTWTVDTRAPSVSLTAPTDGATVGGTVQLSAEATDNVAVDRVEFLVNGTVVGSDATAPYVVNWNSTTFNSDGARIAARAVDTSNNAATSAAHTVTVDATAPTITSWAPKGTGVSSRAKPTVTFSEKMDEASVLPATFFLKKGTATVAATVSYMEGETATGAKVYKAVLTPNKRLRSGAKYTATVTTAAKDAAGNALDQNPSLAGNQPMTWRFTVK